MFRFLFAESAPSCAESGRSSSPAHDDVGLTSVSHGPHCLWRFQALCLVSGPIVRMPRPDKAESSPMTISRQQIGFRAHDTILECKRYISLVSEV